MAEQPPVAADGCAKCQILRVYANSAWQRGFRMGRIENERIARDAQIALAREREAHADTNTRLSEALLAAEAEVERLQACARAAKGQA